MKKNILFLLVIFIQIVVFSVRAGAQYVKDSTQKIHLSGQWGFDIDSLDAGINERWFTKKLKDNIQLPGSMTTNGKGNNITVHTPWTGSILDSAWFFKAEYAKFRAPGNVKIPFWLQPVKYYKGAAWYQKEITIPTDWKGKHLELFIERSHWETTVWIDNQQIGMKNSLGTPHVFNLSAALKPGKHTLTIRVDNRVKDFDVGQNSHSISDHTQSNWNGMVGDLFLSARPTFYIEDVQLYPDVKNKQVRAKVTIHSDSDKSTKTSIRFSAALAGKKSETLKPLTREVEVKNNKAELEVIYPMGDQPLLWDEFHPNLYQMNVSLSGKNGQDEKVITFGMREFSTKGTQFTINDRLIFLRGTLECAIFPKTGYPPTDTASWARIFKICKSYGLNHMRFHSWTPPKAAFDVADQMGFYLQIENSSWAGFGSSIGDGKPLDKYIYDESERVVKEFGNHPSFCMMAYGNEPSGKDYKKYLIDFVEYWKQKDSRRLYTTAAGWPVVKESDYNNPPEPRIQRWAHGLKSIINAQPPRSDYDWTKIIANWKQPTVSHEIGQWCVYPNFKEISKYDGVLKAKNFEIFEEKLRDNGMINLADSFLLASGKLQALCYKADIEAAMRTPGFGGFQLLDLHDFPGQGTALVGVLDPFWDDKGYITAAEYNKFCNSTVPLARFPKMIYLNNEELSVPVEISHFGEHALKNVTPQWTIVNTSGQILYKGQLDKTDIPLGNTFKLGVIRQTLAGIKEPEKLIVTVSVNDAQNAWDIFVYPATLPEVKGKIQVTQQLDAAALKTLREGGNVLLSIQKGTVKPEKGGNVKIGFSSIFWNTAWTNSTPPTTLGVLCNPAHPALKAFPTDYHSNWQWWDGMSHSNAIRLDAVSADLKPIVRVIDDWVTAQPLGLLFECKIGKGKLLVSGIDLLTDTDKRPEARQLLYSLKKYMTSNNFNPMQETTPEKIAGLFK